jgi:hypothetical protein
MRTMPFLIMFITFLSFVLACAASTATYAAPANNVTPALPPLLGGSVRHLGFFWDDDDDTDDNLYDDDAIFDDHGGTYNDDGGTYNDDGGTYNDDGGTNVVPSPTPPSPTPPPSSPAPKCRDKTTGFVSEFPCLPEAVYVGVGFNAVTWTTNGKSPVVQMRYVYLCESSRPCFRLIRSHQPSSLPPKRPSPFCLSLLLLTTHAHADTLTQADPSRLLYRDPTQSLTA